METQRPKLSAQATRASEAESGGITGTIESTSKARRIAFRLLAVITSLWLLTNVVFGLLEVVLMWLPGETLSSMFGDDFSEIDRAHLMSLGIVAWALMLAMLVQLRKPPRRVAPMLQLMAIAVGASVMFALSGTLGEWLLEEVTILVPVLLLAAWHPSVRALFSRPTLHGGMAWLTALAVVPWAWYIIDNARLQLTSASGDPHVEPEHWATAALMRHYPTTRLLWKDSESPEVSPSFQSDRPLKQPSSTSPGIPASFHQL